MKLMFASDLHGSLFFCSKLMEAYRKENPDKLILLGDLLYHGPGNGLTKDYDTLKVTEMLNSVKDSLICTRGNCDADVDQLVLEFPIMSDYSTIYLDGRMLFLTHGHIYNENNLPYLSSGDIIIHGHTHVPKIESIGNGIIYMNPGSVSAPRQNSRNTFMIYENHEFKIKDFDDNVIYKYKI